jgi:hypothetical protein
MPTVVKGFHSVSRRSVLNAVTSRAAATTVSITKNDFGKHDTDQGMLYSALLTVEFEGRKYLVGCTQSFVHW